MDEHERRLKDFGRALGDVLSKLLVPEAGLPRPIIRLDNAMPLLLPVNQDALHSLKTFVEDAKKEFVPAALVFHVQLYRDPYQRKTLTVPYPYAELAMGEVITRLDDSRPVKMARLVVQGAPPAWRTLKPLEVLMQAQAKHVRHGVALGVGPIVPYRVPREEIPGKPTGI